MISEVVERIFVLIADRLRGERNAWMLNSIYSPNHPIGEQDLVDRSAWKVILLLMRRTHSSASFSSSLSTMRPGLGVL